MNACVRQCVCMFSTVIVNQPQLPEESDVDWACLIDGSSDRDLHRVCQIQQRLEASLESSPNPRPRRGRRRRLLRPLICCGSIDRYKAYLQLFPNEMI